MISSLRDDSGFDRLEGNMMADLCATRIHAHRDESKLQLFKAGKRHRKNEIFAHNTHAQEDEVGENLSSYCGGTLPQHQKLAPGWYNLSKEEMALLEIDIFKPLDCMDILLKRIKEDDSGRVISNMNELWK